MSLISESYLPEQVLPHRAPMMLLGGIEQCGEDSIVCRCSHTKGDIFTDEKGRRPAWVGLEYMCQSIAALEGVIRLREKKSIKPSFVIGSKRVRSVRPYFNADELLTVHIETQVRDDSMFGAYSAEIHSQGKCIVTAIIKGVMIENPNEIWGQPRSR